MSFQSQTPGTHFNSLLQPLGSFAGDLHFYMRHSFCAYQAAAPQAPSPANEAGVQADGKAASQAPSADSQPSSNSSSFTTPIMAESSRSKAKTAAAVAQPSEATNGLSHRQSHAFGTSPHAAPAELPKASAKRAQRDTESAGPSSTAVHLRVSTGQHPSHPSMAEPAPATYASSVTSATSADDSAEVQGCRGSRDGVASSGQSTSSGWHPHDPEHLIVNGLGGAFLHPTHVFSPSRFVSGVVCCTALLSLFRITALLPLHCPALPFILLPSPLLPCPPLYSPALPFIALSSLLFSCPSLLCPFLPSPTTPCFLFSNQVHAAASSTPPLSLPPKASFSSISFR